MRQDTSPLRQFRRTLDSRDVVELLRADLVGSDAVVTGPYGTKPLIYADYVASGRALATVEQFILRSVLPFYSNTHTEASYCGEYMTRLRQEARGVIADCCGADRRYAVIFAGSGATAGLNRLVQLWELREAIAAGRRVRVVLGPYEHHSNILPWRESGAEIIQLAESRCGGPDIEQLDEALSAAQDAMVVCAFSAASNVTGIVSDVAGITRRVKAAGGSMVWDYAGAGPYLPIAMAPADDAAIDAVALSPHKFVGGPGASGVLIVRKDSVGIAKPTAPGGGTVRYVSRSVHDYSDDLETREESGTPNVLGDIRAALAFLVKEALGEAFIQERNQVLADRVVRGWLDVPGLELLGNHSAKRLPIFSFRIRDDQGRIVHQQLVTRLLSDRFGIQARGGCACAGPYVHELLKIGDDEAARIRRAILDGDEMAKPGFTRLNFSVLLNDATVDFIIDAVVRLAGDAHSYAPTYDFDPRRAIFTPKAAQSIR